MEDELHIWANSNSNVKAEYNWWGSSPPNSNSFFDFDGSSIDYTPYLSEDPNEGKLSGSDSPFASLKGDSLNGSFDHSILSGLYLARYYHSQENYTAAIAEYKKIIRQYTNSQEGLYALRRIINCYHLSNLSGLEYYLNQIIRNYQRENLGKLALKLRVDLLLEKGMPVNAISRCQEILEMFPEDVRMKKDILFKMCSIYLNDLKDQDRAIETLTELENLYLQNNECINDKLIEHIQVLLHNNYANNSFLKRTKVTTVSTVPNKYNLKQNYPNPFNPSTKISYSLLRPDLVTLRVYDLLGREIVILINKYQDAGAYTVNFDSSRLPSGIYFYRLQAGNDYVETKKMLLMR